MAEALKATHLSTEVEMQSTSLDIWDKKYRLKDKNADPVDAGIMAMVEVHALTNELESAPPSTGDAAAP